MNTGYPAILDPPDKEVQNVLHHIIIHRLPVHRSRPPLHVHTDIGHPQPAHSPQHGRIQHTTADVIDDNSPRPGRLGGHPGIPGID